VPQSGLSLVGIWGGVVYFVGKVDFGWEKDMGEVVVVGGGSGMRCVDRLGGNGWMGLWGRRGRGEEEGGGSLFAIKLIFLM
jgi:hypothetical protein